MISVGVDISRLGLMLVAGQPKTTAEYIRAASRVGRLPQVGSGLVVSCLNVYESHDWLHYERFLAYHYSFYREVEASSLTPLSGPALERRLGYQVLEPDRQEPGTLDVRFAASNSTRHVEATVWLWLERQPLGGSRS